MDRVLITGGSGFIGSNLMTFYLNKNFQCVNIDINEPEIDDHKKYWRKVDILNYQDVEKAVLEFKPTYILHMAARTDINEKKDVNKYAVNFSGIDNLIKVVNKCKSVKRVIFASSMLVCKVGYQPKNYQDYCPPNPYGESKVLMEKLINEYPVKNFEWVIIRPTSIWGPGFKAPYKFFFDMVLKGKYVKFSGKNSVKTFGFIQNSIYQIDKLMFLNKDLVCGKTFYIGDNPPIAINEWADELGKQLNKRIITIPFWGIKLASLIGDALMAVGIPFPMYSFRLKNMTTDNVVNLLADTTEIIPERLYTMEEGTAITLNWMQKQMIR